MEIFWGVDEIEIDDSLFQLGPGERSTNFLNIQSIRYYDYFKSYSSDGKSDPVFAIHIGM